MTGEAGIQSIASAEGGEARSFEERFVAALRLDGSLYLEVAGDPHALPQAAAVALIAAAARSVAVLAGATTGQALLAGSAVLLLWPVASLLIWLTATALRSHGEIGRILRAVGFAMAPLAVFALEVVPNEWFRGGVSLVGYALLFGAILVSVRAALRVDTGRAAFVCVVFALGAFFFYSVAIYAAIELAGIR